MIQFNKTHETRILELGGGQNRHPQADVNVDVRSGPGVDFAASFEEPLPLQSAEFDAVYCAYCLEHLSWRKVPQFLSEVFRVLKPGGKAVLLTPDTRAQIKWLTDHPEGWDGKSFFESASCVLFGDCDYPENSHKTFLEPGIVHELFSRAGFSDVLTRPWGERSTDLLTEAHKPQKGSITLTTATEAPTMTQTPIEAPKSIPEPSKAVSTIEGVPREELYDKHYWNGGKKYGGYAREGYWDFPVHHVSAQKILDRKPQSVLEIGASRGYVLKRIQDAGIPGVGVEISKHCVMTAVADDVRRLDVCTDPLPEGIVGLGRFDLCYSIAVLEHIPEQFIGDVIRKMARVSQRGLHGIDFGGKDDGFDKTHCFPAGTEVLLADGSTLAIEDVVEGDRVAGVDGESVKSTPIIRTYRRRTDELVQLVLANGGKITGTPEHPILTERGWVRLADISTEDTVHVASYSGAGEVRPRELRDEELPGNVRIPRAAVGTASQVRQVQVGTEQGKGEEVFLDRRGEGKVATVLHDAVEIGDFEDISQSDVAVDHGGSPKRRVDVLVDERVLIAVAGVEPDRRAGCVHRRVDRRGRMCVHPEGQKQAGVFSPTAEEDRRVSSGGVLDLQHRSEDDRVCARPARRHGQSQGGEEKNAAGSVCRQREGVPGIASRSRRPSLHDHQAGGDGRADSLPRTANVEAKVRSSGCGGIPVVRGVAKVVSAEKLPGMGQEVFNIETGTHNYVANGVVVHNCNLQRKEIWQGWFAQYAPGYPVEVVDKEELEQGGIPESVLKGDGKVKLNIGSATVMYHHGWLNIDVNDLTPWASHYGYQFLRHDVSKGLPFGTGGVDAIHMSHVLEHFSYADGHKLLAECRRVLKPDGVVRIAVPDADLLAALYTYGEPARGSEYHLSDFDEINDGCEAAKTDAGKLWALLNEGHHAIYDAGTLEESLRKAGLNPSFPGFRKGRLTAEVLDMFRCLSLYAEGTPVLG